jgi:protein SCO1
MTWLQRLIARVAAPLRAQPALLPLTALALAALLAVVVLYGGGTSPATTQMAAAQIGGPFRLTGPDGRIVTERSFPGKWMLVFFGYTFCPDVCPTTMIEIAQALEALGPRAAEIEPLFITVDPERDTPKVLKDYTAHFDARIIGLSGSAEAIAAVEKAYRVYAAKRPGTNGAPYLFDHSAIIYLMNPSGVLAAHFSPSGSGAALAAGIRDVLDGKSGDLG